MITVIMPTRNCRETIEAALQSLGEGCQGVPARLMICDNASTDRTPEVVYGPHLKRWMASVGVNDVTVLPPVPEKDWLQGQEQINAHLCHLMAKFVYEMSRKPPEYVLQLDADVVLPRGALKVMAETMRAHPGLGVLGIPYAPTDHVKQGCTLYAYNVLRQISENGGFGADGCPCRYIDNEAVKRGWKVRHLNGWKAVHLKEVKDGV